MVEALCWNPLRDASRGVAVVVSNGIEGDTIVNMSEEL
jgi:hypothetical protein